MSCCEEKIKEVIALAVAAGKAVGSEKAGQIIKGHVSYNVSRLFRLPDEKYEFADGRLNICRRCEKQTWLTWAEYFGWLRENTKEVIENFEQLEKLPELPKKEEQPRMKLFCMVCKCYLPAKAWVEKEKCPFDKWQFKGV